MIEREMPISIPDCRGEHRPIADRSVGSCQDSEHWIETEYSFPAVSTQAHVLVGERQVGKASAYNIVHAWRLTGRIDPTALEAALNELVARHDLLRAVFIDSDDGFDCCVRKQVRLSLERGEDGATQEDLKRFAAAPFSLADTPLLRLGLFKRVDGETTLVLSIHHVVADDTAIDVLCADLCTTYDCVRTGGAVATLPTGRFAEMAELEPVFARTEVYRQQLAALTVSVANRPPTAFSPRPLPPSAREPEDGLCHQPVPLPLAERINRFCRETRSTPYLFFCAVFGALAARYAGEEESLFAAVTGNRPKASLRRVCGSFVNTVPVRLSIEKESFQTYYPKARAEILRAVQYHGVPYSQVLRRQAAQGIAPAPLRIAFLEKRPTPPLTLGKVSGIPELLWIGATKLDLTAFLIRTPAGFELHAEYSNAHYTRACVTALLDAFVAAAEACLEFPQTLLAELPLLDADRAERAIAQSFGPHVVVNKAPVTTDILHQCERSAERIAASDVAPNGTRRELTYRALGAASLAVMNVLREAGVRPGDLVGVYMRRGIELSVALLGLLRAGCVYLPLDPDTPKTRLCAQATIAAVVLTAPDGERFDGLSATKLIEINLAVHADAANSIDVAQFEADAYLIHTSGTSGTPKGVVNTHRGLRNRLDWQGRAYPIGPSDVVLQKTPISFDVSVWELIWPLMHGARIHYARPGGHKDAAFLDETIVSEGVTVLHFVPSMLGHFLECTPPGHRGSVRHLICSGEALPKSFVEKWRECFGGAVHNLYGPTEGAIDVTFFDYEEGDADPMLPIGYPIQNTAIFILDKSFAPVPIGAVGDLYIAGENLARCYFSDVELTNRRFIWRHLGERGEMRLYASGDRARRRADGAVLFEGRIDSQIKLNGVRIELGEVETSLRAHPDVIDAAVVLQSDGNPFLAAFYRSDRADLDIAALSDWLLQHLPQSHLPAAYRRLGQFPSTISGKLDRGSFEILNRGSAERQQVFTPPETRIEVAIARIWEDVLGVFPIGLDDNFYAVGGDSLRSLRCVARLKEVGLAVEIVEFLKHPTVRALAGVVRLCLGAVNTAGSLGSSLRRYLAPSIVQALWVAGEIRGDYRSYVTSYLLSGRLDLNALQEAVDKAVQRHPILRSALRPDANGKLFIEVEDSARVVLEVEDFRRSDLEEEVKASTDWLDSATRHRWRWEAPALFRCVVHRFSNDRFRITLIEPWLDGWSVQTLALELFNVYVALLDGGDAPEQPPIEDSFADFAAAEEAAMSDPDHHDFWRGVLAEMPETRVSPDSRDGRLIRIDVDLGPSAMKLRALASGHGVPLKSLLMGVHGAVISLLTGADAPTTGVMFNGRLEKRGGERTLGCYLNALPISAQVSSASWIGLARQYLDSEILLTPWRRFPSDGLRRALNGDRFDSLFNYTDFTVLRQAPFTPDIKLLNRVGYDQTYMSLTAQFSYDIGQKAVTLYLEAIEPLTRRIGVQELADAYAFAVSACCNNPEGAVADWRRQAIAGRRGAQLSLSRLQEGSLAGLFEALARAVPEQVALQTSDGVETSYTALRRRAAEIAAGLQQAGVRPGHVVGVNLPRTPDLIAAMMAIFAVGGVFLPLPPDAPCARLRFMAEDGGVVGVIGGETFDQKTWTVQALSRAGTGATELPAGDAGREDGAHILYTSGSTGRPKGVLTPHRVVLNRLSWMWRAFPFEPGEVVAQKTTLGFVDSIWELLGGVLAGVQTYIFSDEAARDPVVFAEEIRRGRCTRLTLTPSFAEALLRDCPDLASQLASLRLLVLSGEPLKLSLASRLADLCPQAQVVNLYGSTETGGDATCFVLDQETRDWPLVPIGSPIDHCVIDVTDANGAPVYPGVIGEIMVSGACVSAGYVGWAREAEAAVGEPESPLVWRTGDLGYVDHDGRLHYVGRADRQVKIRGVRIHPAEIEEALCTHPLVGECVCLLDPCNMLSVFYLSRSIVPDLRDWLAERLPMSHLPSRFVLVDRIPKTLSGKVDPNALLELGELLRANDADREPTQLEQSVIEAAQLLLGESHLITPSSDFFALGGDSLAAATLARRLSARFNILLPVRAVFEASVIADLAARIETERWRVDS